MKRCVILLFLILLFVSCTIEPENITYEITGLAEKVNLKANSMHLSHIELPWTYEFSAVIGSSLYLEAQDCTDDPSSISVTVTIYVNNTLFKTSTCSEAACIAAASGVCP
jgi:hypothetical protein